MKRKFTRLLAAAMLLMLITPPAWMMGQAPVNTVLWAETWTGATTSNGNSGQANATPSANYGHGTTVYNNGTVTYSQSANSVYVRNENIAGGESPELMLTSGQTWTISNIPTGEATELTLTYKTNNTKSYVTCSTAVASISGSSGSYTITTGSASTITLVFGCSGNTRIDDVSLIVKTAGSKVATPELSVGTGTYNNNQSVEISCATAGATIRYTTDGSTPNESSSIYSSAITVNTTNTTITAKAFKDDLDPSDPASATYTLTCANPAFSVVSGTYDQAQTVEISCATTGATIHYTTDGSTPTASSATYSSALSVSVNTTLKAIAFKSGYNNSSEAEATYNIKVAAPSFTPSAGRYPNAQNVTISSATNDATIYYTIGDNPSDPTTESFVYSGPIEVSATTTIKALAVKENMTNSSLTSATYTIQAPYTTIPALFAAATSTATDVFVTFSDWKVVDVKDNDVYVTDGQYGLRINNSNHGFVKGNNLSGTVDCKLSLAYGGIKLSNITASSPGLTVTTSTIGAPYATNITSLDGQYYGSYIDLGELTYQSSGTKFTDGTNTINLVKINQDLPSLTNGKKYFVKGIYTSTVSGQTVTKRISPVSATDIVPKPVITTNVTAIAAPNYYYQTPENNISYEILTVSGTDLTSDITVALENGASSDFEMSTDLESWASSVTINKGNGSVSNQSISVRLKAGKTVADYTDKIILTSTDAETKNVDVTGSVVYAHVVYNGNGANVSNLPTDGNNYSYNDEVIVLGGVSRTGYEFAYWTPTQDGSGSDAYEENNKFNITENITLYAQWDANTYNLTAATMYHGSVSFTVGGIAAITANTDQTVTLVVSPNEGYALNSLTVTDANNNPITVTNNSFVMPGSDVTVNATFGPVVTDELTATIIGQTSYGNWSGKSGGNDAIYAGNSTKGGSATNSIQLRASDNSGIVTTTSGGKAKKVSVSWNSSTSTGRTLQIFGKNSAYSGTTGASDLYDNDKRGTLIGTIVYGTSTELVINDDYEYIGMRSSSNAMYLDKIQIIWAPTAYTLTYDANGGSGELIDYGNPYIYNQTVMVLGSNTLTAPDGKVFQCWNANAEGDGKDYYPGDTVKMPRSNKTLFAKWANPCDEPAVMNTTTGVVEYTNTSGVLSYKVNLSSSVQALSSCAAIVEYGFVYSTSVQEPAVGTENCTKIVKGNADPTINEAFTDEIANVPLNTTYYIRSYATNLAGTAYGEKATVIIAEDYPTYTISYTTNGKPEATTTQVYQGNTISELLEAPTADYVPTGYNFMGWYGGEYSNETTAPTYVAVGNAISSDITLKAVFAESTTKTQETTKSYGFETATDLDWTINGPTRESGNANTGEYAGKISGNHSYVTFNSKVKVKEFSFAFKRMSNNDNYNVYIETSSDNSTWTAVETYPMSGFNNGSYLTKTKSFDGTTALYVRFHCYNTTAVRYVDDVTIKYEEEVLSYTNYCTSVANIITDITTDTERSTDIPNYEFVTVKSGATLTFSGDNLGTAENLIIEDGGQLIASNAVAATVVKSIANWNTNNWYFISSPIGGVAPSSVTGMITDTYTGDDNAQRTYDLYSLDITEELGWQNYRLHNTAENPFMLVNGMGYLYASKEGTMLNFTGNIQPSNTNVPVSGLNDGFNLVGNPFTCEAYINQPYYTLSQAETGINTSSTTATAYTTAIAPLTGVVISGTSATFSKNVPDGSINNGNVEMVLSQTVTTRGESSNQTLDNAIVSFNEGSQLEKFYFGSQNANLYISQGTEEYAIVSTEAQGEMPVSFRANENGQYTLTVNAEGVEMNYLHLIDNMTGADIDLLQTPSYTFNAKTTDYESRFRLVFAANNEDGSSTGSETFSFFSNGNWVISNEGEATLQVIDALGRILSSEEINGSVSKNINAPAGVYVLGLINGDSVKTQKIVVR